MTYTLIIREEALSEAKDAYLYYENLQENLGKRFLSELEERFRQISKNPQYFGFIDGRKVIRDVKVKHFPYQVVYEIIQNTVVVYSIFNTYQNPSKKDV